MSEGLVDVLYTHSNAAEMHSALTDEANDLFKACSPIQLLVPAQL